MFGNQKNIALYFANSKITQYDELDEEQQSNVDSILRYATSENPEYWINFDTAIPERRQYKAEYDYCGKNFYVLDNSIGYEGRVYWNLDNL